MVTLTECQDEEIMSHTGEITRLLKTPPPVIHLVDYIYIVNGTVFITDLAPAQSGVFPGQYAFSWYEPENRIAISKNDVLSGREFTDTELISLLAHEMRHYWQKAFHYDQYFGYDIQTVDSLDDEAEIDADAFSFLYVSSRMNCTINDMNIVGRFNFINDNGMRYKRTETLRQEFAGII